MGNHLPFIMSRINCKAKGSGYERSIAKTFREHGWHSCATSRFQSKMMDDAGVDLVNTEPFYVQCKAVEGLRLHYHDILASMPNEDNHLNVIFHKRSRKGTVVTLAEKDFWKLVQLAGLPVL